ncbi:hypothetical protein BDN70DRAFT_876119 [Pholiota conissans]|uniref:HNH nuclease domain-containing protein n=1 Tax=Pholiota conissans TaxID=109636 RepID=A0A9P5Z7K1_9AGAR|nr:hypothetical protein BDN70DRAFT_876119 [Pholiota conissans]
MSGLPDAKRIADFIAHGRLSKIPRTGCFQISRMEAAHIIPFSLNKFQSPTEQLLASLTWDMLRAWTGIHPEELRGRQIDSPSNQIYLNTAEHLLFDTFQFGFEERPNFPDSYLIKSNLQGVGIIPHIVTFRNVRNSGVDAPNPRFLKAHLAIGKVISSSGYANH